MSKKEVVVNEIHCDRCPAYMGREILSGKRVSKKDMRLENKGPFKAVLGNHKLEYEHVCPRCYDILERLVEKAGPVKRGRSRKKKKG